MLCPRKGLASSLLQTLFPPEKRLPLFPPSTRPSSPRAWLKFYQDSKSKMELSNETLLSDSPKVNKHFFFFLQKYLGHLALFVSSCRDCVVDGGSVRTPHFSHAVPDCAKCVYTFSVIFRFYHFRTTKQF